MKSVAQTILLNIEDGELNERFSVENIQAILHCLKGVIER
jgi:hypothetical protein